MNKNTANKLMNALLMISAFVILLGAFFKLQHYPLGNTIFYTGVFMNLLISSFEISRLKKIIASYEEKRKVKID